MADQDSHAKLAAEMRLATNPDGPAKGYFAPGLFEEWAARVEQLGREVEAEDAFAQATLDRYKAMRARIAAQANVEEKKAAFLEAAMAFCAGAEDWLACNIDLAAREVEIATEVKWITEMCERYWKERNIGDAEIHSVLASIRASAARLGGAS